MKSNKDNWDICAIGGGGHVGLPLSIAFANRGQRVVVYDLNAAVLAKVRRGIMPFKEHNAQRELKKALKSGRLTLSGDRRVVGQSSHLIITIGTPIDSHLSPDLIVLRQCLDDLWPYLRPHQLLILRSTIYPGTTAVLSRYIRERGLDIDIAFCPERICEGQALEEYRTLPQIVSGTTEAALQRAKKLFGVLARELIELSPMEAELAKLFTNSWRYLKFAIANQFYMLASDHNLDFYKIHRAMTFNYPRAKDFALPGFTAGPCLLKDTMQLSSFTGNSFFMGHSAMLVNEGLPEYVVRKVKHKVDLRKKTVGILGMAFKAESDDLRDSLSVKLKKVLEYEAGKVLCSDEYIKYPGWVSAEELVRRADVTIIGAPHRRYRTLDYRETQLVDIWDFVKPQTRAS